MTVRAELRRLNEWRYAWLQERQYSSAYHWSYSRNNRLEYALRTRVVLDLLALEQSPGARLLDVGCGDARFVAEAARHAEVWGTDPSARALRHARRLVGTARFVRGSAG